MKGCFPEADTGERMFGYSRHVEGLLMEEYKYDPTDSEGQALSFDLVCSALLFIDKLSLRGARPRNLPEVPESVWILISIRMSVVSI